MPEDEKPFFRCTYEWDEEHGRDGRNDPIFRRHICCLEMHHEGPHVSSFEGDAVEHEGLTPGVKSSPNTVAK